jgi:translation initiation factor 4A
LGVSCGLFVGGNTSVGENIRAIRAGNAQIGIGTPGRVLDLLTNHHLPAQHVRQLVLDEADEMLSLGFKEQVQEIFSLLPEDTQVMLYSATMEGDVLALTRKFMRDPLQILLKQEEVPLEGIRQFYIALDNESWKFETLCDLYDTLTVSQSIIFCKSRRQVDWLTAQMESKDFTVSAIHSDLAPAQRKTVVDNFRSGNSRVLLATDLVARGLDVQQVSLVINYDVPSVLENYIHRIGRAGRHGRKGVAVSFVTPAEQRAMLALREHYHVDIKEMPANIKDLL